MSKHLRVLERAGLISRHRDAQRRPCRLEPDQLRRVSDWVGSYRQFWDESFERLDEYIEQLSTQQITATGHDHRQTTDEGTSDEHHDA